MDMFFISWYTFSEYVENIVEKRENAGYQHFLLFPQCFQKPFFSKVVKVRDCIVKCSGWSLKFQHFSYTKVLQFLWNILKAW